MELFLKIGDRFISPEHIIGLLPGVRTDYREASGNVKVPTWRLLIAVPSGGGDGLNSYFAPEEWLYDQDSPEGRGLLGWLEACSQNIADFATHAPSPPPSDPVADELAKELGKQVRTIANLRECLKTLHYHCAYLFSNAKLPDDVHNKIAAVLREALVLRERSCGGDDSLLMASAAVVACFTDDPTWWGDVGDHYEGKKTSAEIRELVIKELRVAVENAEGATR